MRVTWYDRASLYDRAFSWDPTTERTFLLSASTEHGRGAPARTLEPFCGTGRLWADWPGAVVGVDCNPSMLELARTRGSVLRGDVTALGLADRSFDFAFALIDSFRHLLTHDAALRHLREVARVLRPGGVYVLGFDVTGDLPSDVSRSIWTQNGVHAEVYGLGDADPTTRIETVRAILTDTRSKNADIVDDVFPMRTYTNREIDDLLHLEGSFQRAATFNRTYKQKSRAPGSQATILKKSTQGGTGFAVAPS